MKLPPLNAIKAFEATVRYGGFTAAAAELSVSSAAISLQIRAGGKALRLWSAFPVPPLLWSVPLQQERRLLK